MELASGWHSRPALPDAGAISWQMNDMESKFSSWVTLATSQALGSHRIGRAARQGAPRERVLAPCSQWGGKEAAKQEQLEIWSHVDSCLSCTQSHRPPAPSDIPEGLSRPPTGPTRGFPGGLAVPQTPIQPRPVSLPGCERAWTSPQIPPASPEDACPRGPPPAPRVFWVRAAQLSAPPSSLLCAGLAACRCPRPRPAPRCRGLRRILRRHRRPSSWGAAGGLLDSGPGVPRREKVSCWGVALAPMTMGVFSPEAGPHPRAPAGGGRETPARE